MRPRPSISSAVLLSAVAFLAGGCAGAEKSTWSTVRPPDVYVETLPPGASVAVDGADVGHSPVAIPIRDPGHAYAIRGSAPGFEVTELSATGEKLAGSRLQLVLRPVGFGSGRRLDAADPVGLLLAANLLLKADRPADGLAFAQASLAAGETAQAHRAAGEAYRRLGNRNEAIQEFSLYVTQAPGAPDRAAIEAAIAAARRDIAMPAPPPGK